MRSLLVPIIAAVLTAGSTAAAPPADAMTCRQVITQPSSTGGRPVTLFTCTVPATESTPSNPTPPPTTAAPKPAVTTPAVLPFYVDPQTPAAQQEREWQAAGRTADAKKISAIADQPQPLWIGGPNEGVTSEVREYADRAKAAGARPLYVGYDIPDRDCGSYSGGGASDAADYRAWATAFAEGLRGSSAVVVLEPDAIPHQLSGCAGQGDERYALLADATAKLSAAGAQVYLDAGNPGFTGDVDATAEALRKSGVAKAAGFSVNVSNFVSTQENVTYGTAISEKLGGAHFVIDTSRNGAPGEPESTDGAPSWCNPPGRLLGTPPTVQTGNPLVDAFLWVKRPGESDGSCRDGDPTAGDWFPAYALSLVATVG